MLGSRTRTVPPFAPSILEDRIGESFEQTHPSPAMLMVYQIKQDKRSLVPAVTHVDGSGRLQTVSHSTNPRYHRLICDLSDYRCSGCAEHFVQ